MGTIPKYGMYLQFASMKYLIYKKWQNKGWNPTTTMSGDDTFFINEICNYFELNKRKIVNWEDSGEINLYFFKWIKELEHNPHFHMLFYPGNNLLADFTLII